VPALATIPRTPGRKAARPDMAGRWSTIKRIRYRENSRVKMYRLAGEAIDVQSSSFSLLFRRTKLESKLKLEL
jgi:hypothetical protein